VNRKRVSRVMRERGCWCIRVVCAHEGKKWGRVEAAEPNQIWESGHDEDLGGSCSGRAYPVWVIDRPTFDWPVAGQ